MVERYTDSSLGSFPSSLICPSPSRGSRNFSDPPVNGIIFRDCSNPGSSGCWTALKKLTRSMSSIGPKRTKRVDFEALHSWMGGFYCDTEFARHASRLAVMIHPLPHREPRTRGHNGGH